MMLVDRLRRKGSAAVARGQTDGSEVTYREEGEEVGMMMM